MTQHKILFGKTIVVTRPLAQAQKICESLELHQAKIVHFPVVQIIAANDLVDTANAFKELYLNKIIIFTSSNAVNYAIDLANQLDVSFHGSEIAAIGPATKSALELHGYSVKIYPESKFTSEALLEHSTFQNVKEQHILIIKGKGGREHLRQVLASRGANVTQAEVYQRGIPENRNPVNLAMLAHHDTVVLVYSVEAAQNLWTMCSKSEQTWLAHVAVITGSNRIAEAITAVGFAKKPIIAENPSDEAMLNAVITWAENN